MLDPASLAAGAGGVDTAYYLVHSMGSAGRFEEQDRRAAGHFARRGPGGRRAPDRLPGRARRRRRRPLAAPRAAGRRSARVLRESGVPVLEFRASIVIGSGSLSFEMIRALVERLPVMITPRWVRVPAQPIAIDDVLAYLLAALDLPPDGSRVFEIGGAERGLLRRPDARVRPPAGPAALDDPGAGADPAPLEPLARPRHARLRPRRPEAHREHPQPDGGPRPLGVRAFRVRPVGMREAIASALRNEDRGVRRDPLVGRRVVAGARPRLGRPAVRQPAGRLARRPRRRAAGTGLRPVHRIGGDDGLVLRRLALAPARLPRPARRRRRAAARPPRSGRAARRRAARLLARRGLRAGPPAAAPAPR